MVVTKAVLRGDKHKLLKFNNLEKLFNQEN